MPEMTGLELIRWVRSNSRPDIQNIPIILASGDFYGDMSPQDIQKRAVKVGANAGFIKPFDIKTPINIATALLSEK